jgi:hypothetical protein
MYGDFPAKSTVCTPYIPINVWFWPTLVVSHVQGCTFAHLLLACMHTSAPRKQTSQEATSESIAAGDITCSETSRVARHHG